MIPLTIFKRLVIGNIIILLLVFILGSTVIFNLTGLRKLTREIVVKNQESIIVGDRLMDSLVLLVNFGEKYFVSGDIDYYNRFLDVKMVLNRDFEKFKDLMETDEQIAILTAALADLNGYIDWFEETSEQLKSEKKNNMDLFLKENHPDLNVTTVHLKKIIAVSQDIITAKTNQSIRMSHQILVVTVFITVLTVFFGGIITIFNTRSITKSVNRLQKKTKDISQGHFEEIQAIKGPKEIQDLSLHFNTMCRRLKELDGLKADFVSHVSHELRTPIASIKEAIYAKEI